MQLGEHSPELAEPLGPKLFGPDLLDLGERPTAGSHLLPAFGREPNDTAPPITGNRDPFHTAELLERIDQVTNRLIRRSSPAMLQREVPTRSPDSRALITPGSPLPAPGSLTVRSS